MAPRETIETCGLCHSLCRAIECGGMDHKFLKPLLEGQLAGEEARAKIVDMLQSAKFCQIRLDKALNMLLHVESFLESKGHKVVRLEVKRTIESLRDKREA